MRRLYDNQNMLEEGNGRLPHRIVTMVFPAPSSFAIISAATTFKAVDAPIYSLSSTIVSQHEIPLLIQQPVNHLNGQFVRDMKRIIYQFDIRLQIIRHPPLSNPYPKSAPYRASFMSTLRDTPPTTLNQLPPTLNIRIQHTPRWIRQKRLYPSTTVLLQNPGDTRQCPCGPCRAGKPVNFPGCLFPDLGACGFNVRTTIRRVVELVCPDAVGSSFGVAFGLVIVVFGVFVGHRGHGVNFGSQHP